MKKEFSYKAFFYSMIGMLLLLCVAKCQAIPKDKQDHLLAGSLIGFTASVITFDKPDLTSFVVSIGSATVIGGAKELIYDKWMGKGTPELKDFGYSIGGAVIGWGVITVIKKLANDNIKNNRNTRSNYPGMRFNKV